MTHSPARIVRLSFRILVCLSPLVVGAGCTKRANEYAPPPPPKVTVARPVVWEVTDHQYFTGTTQSVARVDLKSRATGYLREIAFEDGTNVKQGDLLFVIEPKPYEVELKAAKAKLCQAQTALQLATLNLSRARSLYTENASAREEVELRRAEAATAAAEIEVAETAVLSAEVRLTYTEIRAPLSGRIGRHLVDVGNLVQAEGTLLATIEQLDPIHAYFHVSETDLLQSSDLLFPEAKPNPNEKPPVLELGLEAHSSQAGYPFLGHLDFSELGVDPETGTVLRRGAFPNPGGRLIPGLFVRLRSTTGDSQPRLLVEDRAVGSDLRGDYLLVVNDQNVVEQRPVQLGLTMGQLRVIESGITTDDWVIINGIQRARPAAEVDPQKAEMSLPSEKHSPGEEGPAGVALKLD